MSDVRAEIESDRGGEWLSSGEHQMRRTSKRRGCVEREKNLRGFRIFQKHGLLAPAPGRLQTWLPSSTFLAGHTSESAILTRTFSESSRDAHFPSLFAELVSRRITRVYRQNGMSSPLRVWWTLAGVMAYARAHAEWRTSTATTTTTTTTVVTTIRVRLRLSFFENENKFAREEAFDAGLHVCQSVSEEEREKERSAENTAYTARTQRDEDWGLLSTHWRSLVPPPRRALSLPPSRLIAILLGTSYLEDYMR